MRKILNKIVVWMLQTIGVGLTFISPRVNNEMWYYLCYHRRLHLDNPQEFHEKLCWLKIYNYNNNAEVKRCADKFAVRSYVCEHGLPEILNELIAVYDTPDEIEWNALPDSFVIKSNVGSGDNLIVTKKKELDFNSALNQMKKMEEDLWPGTCRTTIQQCPS